MNKNGRIPESEKKIIIELAEKLPYTDIATQLQRNPETIRKFIEKNVGTKLIIGGRTESNYDIKKTILWKELKEQFSENELELFLYHWDRTINQFKDDVLPTEQGQITDMIKIEILMTRIMKEQRESIKVIDSLQDEILKEEKLGIQKDGNKIAMLSSQVAFHRAAKEGLSKEYTQYQQRKDNMLTSLRATRSERVQRIENSKHTVTGWITQLLTNNSLRKELGEHMEKMRIAIDLEKIRLFTPHKYADGVVDCPLLTNETLEYLEKQEEKENKEKEE